MTCPFRSASAPRESNGSQADAHRKKLPVGTIAAGGGGLFALIIVAIGIFCCLKKRRAASATKVGAFSDKTPIRLDDIQTQSNTKGAPWANPEANDTSSAFNYYAQEPAQPPTRYDHSAASSTSASNVRQPSMRYPPPSNPPSHYASSAAHSSWTEQNPSSNADSWDTFSNSNTNSATPWAAPPSSFNESVATGASLDRQNTKARFISAEERERERQRQIQSIRASQIEGGDVLPPPAYSEWEAQQAAASGSGSGSGTARRI